MKRKGTAVLDGAHTVDLLHKQTTIPVGTDAVQVKWFVRFPKGGTGWIDAGRLTNITEDSDGNSPTA